MSGPERVPDLSPRPGTFTADALETHALRVKEEAHAQEKAMQEAMAVAPGPMTPLRLRQLVALGSAVEEKAKEIGHRELHANVRKEVGMAHDALVQALAGVTPLIAVVALDLLHKQYLDAIYESQQ